jgi:diguanylate cyclase (GGDEF)-like protein
LELSAPLGPERRPVAFGEDPVGPDRVREILAAVRHLPAGESSVCRAVTIEAPAEIGALVSALESTRESVPPGVLGRAPLYIALCIEGEDRGPGDAAAWMAAAQMVLVAERMGMVALAIAPPWNGAPTRLAALREAGRPVAILAVGYPPAAARRPNGTAPPIDSPIDRPIKAPIDPPINDDRQFLTSFMEIASASAVAEDLDGVLERIAHALGRLFPVDGATLALREEGQIVVREVLGKGTDETRESERLPEDDSHLMGRVILRDRPVWRNDVGAELRFREPSGRGLLSDMTIPLRARGRVMGAFRVGSRRRHSYDPEDFEVLQRCADLTAVAVETQRLLLATRRLSEQDGLTGVFNHRYFLTLLQQEVQRVHRTGRSLSLLMIDIDDFKRINDTHGHPIGDQVLRHVSQLVGRLLRRSDTVARYGGEEFAALLPEATLEEARSVAETLRSGVERSRVTVPDLPIRLSVTISLGVAALPGDAAGASELVLAADRGLYEAKRTGKNKVCHAP